MTLKYHWENVELHEEVDTGDIAPHTRKVIRDINHIFEVQVKIEDICEYLMPYDLANAKNKTEQQMKEISQANFYMNKAIQFLLDNGSCDLDELENDEYFVEFMHDKYEERAWEDFQESNNEY